MNDQRGMMKSVGPDELLESALEEMQRSGVSQLPVMADRQHVVGILTRDDVYAYLRTLEELAA